MEDSIYIVIGPPRSGTSALAGVLHAEGIPMYLGADAPDLDSPTGNREDALVRIVNNRIMGANVLRQRRDWDNPRYVEAGGKRAERLISAYVCCRGRNASGRWGVKDPRMCFLIEPWHEATRRLNVRWLHIYREDREAMILSLIKMLPCKVRLSGDPKTMYRLAASWAESYHIACALGFARTGIQPYTLSYEQLVTRSGQERLAAELGLDQPVGGIRPELNRSGNTSNGYAKFFRHSGSLAGGEIPELRGKGRVVAVKSSVPV